MHYEGSGVSQDDASAAQWYRQASRPSQRVWWRAMVAAVFATGWSGVQLGEKS